MIDGLAVTYEALMKPECLRGF